MPSFPSSDDIRNALRQVIDPDFQKDIVSLGMVKSIEPAPERGGVDIHVQLTTPLCPLKDRFRADIQAAVAALFDTPADIRVHFSSVSTSAAAPPSVPAERVWLVASGKGGVGKSTVAFFLALALQQSGHRVGFLDADVTGPSLPAMLGPDVAPPRITRKGDEYQIEPVKAHGIQWMSAGFIIEERFPMAWRGPIISKTLLQLIYATQWAPMDILIVDLPPGTGDVPLTLFQHFPDSSGIIVTLPHILAHSDVARAIELFRMPAFNIPVLGIIENMAYYEPRGPQGPRYYPFGRKAAEDLTRRYQIPIAGRLPIDPNWNTFPFSQQLEKNHLILPIIHKLTRREGILAHEKRTAGKHS